jgi:hypothetical protein
MAYHSELGIVCGHCGSPCPGGPNPCCRLYDDAVEELVSVKVERLDDTWYALGAEAAESDD